MINALQFLPFAIHYKIKVIILFLYNEAHLLNFEENLWFFFFIKKIPKFGHYNVQKESFSDLAVVTLIYIEGLITIFVTYISALYIYKHAHTYA